MKPSSQKPLLPPFPWFGGKRRVASQVWARFGKVKTYIEPFFGGGATLFGRPSPEGLETINDADCFVANFWRAVKFDPEATAHHADWPVNEIDLHSRHHWLFDRRTAVRESMMRDPEYFDPKIAGWWVWGQSTCLACRWCTGKPAHSKPKKGPNGVNCLKFGDHQTLVAYFQAIAERLRRVRVCCGDWSRVLTKFETSGKGSTAIFLDPPYTAKAGRDPKLYAEESLCVGHQVAEWAIANGGNPNLRIALCGYEGEYSMPKDWSVYAWKAQGGFGNLGRNKSNTNRFKERIWFSPHSLRV